MVFVVSATISPCGQYRYELRRALIGWPLQRYTACVIMVNPSTADAEKDDATIRKLIGFGKRLAWSDLIVVNLFAYRATDVNQLAVVSDPIGPMNDGHVMSAMIEADIIIVAWGRRDKVPSKLSHRYEYVVRIARMFHKPLYCWGTCADGHPCHPVMLGYDTPLVPWEPPHAMS